MKLRSGKAVLPPRAFGDATNINRRLTPTAGEKPHVAASASAELPTAAEPSTTGKQCIVLDLPSALSPSLPPITEMPRICEKCHMRKVVDNRAWAMLVCGHTFHSHCLRGWETNSNSCPVCQKSMQLYGSVFDYYD